MRRFRLAHLVLSFCGILVSATAAQPQTPSFDSANSNDSAIEASAATASAGMLQIINASRSKYLEGSNLIKSGDSDKARKLFNEAVDIILQSNWDVTSSALLNRHFQDLIQRIQQDESLYLLGENNGEEEAENAVIDDLNELNLALKKIDPALQNTLAGNLDESKYDIPITINDMVSKSLDFWLNNGRQEFIDGLARSGKYKPLIEKVFREESIPLDLMYLAQVESLFKPHALSKAKAKGIWQFEKGTALRYGLKVNRDVDERSDPEKSTRAAAHYLNDLFAMFKDWNLALAAYNWGEGKVQRLINSTGLKDFWQLVDLKKRLPEETKNHVPLIQASVILAKNPEKFGLPAKLDPPLKYTEVSVSKPIDLRAAAKVLSVSIDELKKLNPALKGMRTPANYPNYQLKVPEETDPTAHEQLKKLPVAQIAPVSDRANPVKYKIKPGDTLIKIAAKYNLSVKDLQKNNKLTEKQTIRAGMTLKIPTVERTKSSGEKSEISTKKAVKAKKRLTVKVSAEKKRTTKQASS